MSKPSANAIHTKNAATDLYITLRTDKTSYSIGDEIHFMVEFFNRSSSSFRILIDDTFIGSNIECTDTHGNKHTYDGGFNSWSPKAGVYTGRTYLIEPNKKLVIKMDALVYVGYKLILSNLFERTGNSEYQELKKQNNLPSGFPDKYISAGRIFPLHKADKYRFCYIYEAGKSDKDWQFTGTRTPRETSTDLLWIGKTISNTVEIVIK
jgi:hypothetical protein